MDLPKPFRENKGMPLNGVCYVTTVAIHTGFTFPPHYHEATELMAIKPGLGGTITVNGTPYALKSGAFFYLPPSAIHSCDIKTATLRSFITVYLDPSPFAQAIQAFEGCSFASGMALLNTPIVVTGERSSPLRQLLSQTAVVKRSMNPALPKSNPLIEALDDVGLLSRLLARTFSEQQPLISTADSAPIRAAIDFVGLKYGEHITLDQIAYASALSRSHICREFKRQTGVGLWGYLQQVRIMHAMEMLDRRASNVSQVADACGFNSPSYFTRIFTHVTGTTPKKWQLQKKPAA